MDEPVGPRLRDDAVVEEDDRHLLVLGPLAPLLGRVHVHVVRDLPRVEELGHALAHLGLPPLIRREHEQPRPRGQVAAQHEVYLRVVGRVDVARRDRLALRLALERAARQLVVHGAVRQGARVGEQHVLAPGVLDPCEHVLRAWDQPVGLVDGAVAIEDEASDPVAVLPLLVPLGRPRHSLAVGAEEPDPLGAIDEIAVVVVDRVVQVAHVLLSIIGRNVHGDAQ